MSMAAAESRRAVREAAGGVAGGLPRKVLHVLHSLEVGGSEAFALKIATHLDPARFRSTVCGLDRGGALEPELDRLGIDRLTMNRGPGVRPGVMWDFRRLVRRGGFDVVHTHHFSPLLHAGPAARLAGARLIHTEHSVEHFGRRRRRAALRMLARWCDKVLAVGERVAQVLCEDVGLPARKVEIVLAGVDVSSYAEDRGAARAALGIGEAERVATIIARLHPVKNHPLLLKAFAEVARKLGCARLLVVGEGREEGLIRREVERLGLVERVRLLGTRRDVPRILAATDVFVLSSDSEGLPLAVLEAMAAARPVVATAVGDVPRVVRDGQDGLLVGPGDVAALAGALFELLSDTERAGRLGSSAREQVVREYSLRTMIEKHQALYEGRERSSSSGYEAAGARAR